MELIVSVLKIVYQFGLLPFLIGLLLIMKREKASFAHVYAQGYVVMFALFWMSAVPLVILKQKLDCLAGIWQIVGWGIGIFACIVLLVRHNDTKRKVHELVENFKFANEKIRGILAVFFVGTLLSAAFVMPSEADETGEIVSIAIDTNQMYQYAPYSKVQYEEIPSEKITSPMEMLYAVSSINAGIDANILIHTILPFFFLPLFYAVSWMVARYFYRDNLSKCMRFVMCVMVFYSVACYTPSTVALGIFQNSWNSLALYAGCGFPIILRQCFILLDCVEKKEKINKKDVLFLLCGMIASQLLFEKAMMLGTMTVVACIMLYFMRRGRIYGIITRGNKG